MFDAQNDYGSSAVSVRDDRIERPGNSWLFTAQPVPDKHAVYGI